MSNPLKPRRSFTSGAVPTTSDVAASELVINWADGVLYTKTAAGNILSLPVGGTPDARWDYFKPSAPTSVTATAGNAQAVVSWTAPAVVVPPVTDYVVQYSTDGSSWTTFSDGTSTSTTATVTGLTNNTAYTFRVAAVNGIGTGAYSTASSAATPVAGDAYFGQVALLLHADGTGSTFIDSSPYTRSITANGGATQSSTQSKWGGKALYLDGSGDYIDTGASAGTLVGSTGDFTVEMWLYPTDLSGTRSLFSTRYNGSGNDVLIFGIRSSSLYMDTNSVGVCAGSTTLTANTWQHVAFVRSGNTFTCYLNGTSIASGTASLTFNASQTAFIGAEARNDGGSASQYAGYMDDIRVTKTARTITVPAAAFPDRGVYEDPFMDKVSLLLNLDGSNGSTAFTDSSLNAVSLTATSAVISTTQSKFGGASGYFNGSAYLSVPASSLLEVAGGDFTVEFWWYTATTSRQWFFHSQTDYWLGLDYNNGSLGMWASASGSGWNIIESDSSQGRGSLTVPLNQWNHVAFTRSGDQWRMFLNGVLDKTVTSSASVVNRASEAKFIGSWAGGGNAGGRVNGYLDDFRFTKAARYAANFTPATAAFPDT